MEFSGVIYADNKDTLRIDYSPNIVFARRETRDLVLQLLLPVRPHPAMTTPQEQERAMAMGGSRGRGPKRDERYPLIIFSPGSGWRGGDSHHPLPQLMPLLYRGYAAACIEYRGTERDDVRYPAAVQDLKEAVRFLRANAEQYHIDPDRIGLLGDSSGGHNVATAILTEGDARYDIGENLDRSSAVGAAAILYVPLDLSNLLADRLAEGKTLRPGEGELPYEAQEIYRDDCREDPDRLLAEASPINYIAADKEIPPVIVLQGDNDPIIPLAQSLRFCEKLREAGKTVELFKIAGGKHGPGCWPQKALDLIADFYDAYL